MFSEVVGYVEVVCLEGRVIYTTCRGKINYIKKLRLKLSCCYFSSTQVLPVNQHRWLEIPPVQQEIHPANGRFSVAMFVYRRVPGTDQMTPFLELGF